MAEGKAANSKGVMNVEGSAVCFEDFRSRVRDRGMLIEDRLRGVWYNELQLRLRPSLEPRKAWQVEGLLKD